MRNPIDAGALLDISAPEMYQHFTPAPTDMPFNSQPASFLDVDISTVDPLAGIAPRVNGSVIPIQNMESDLLKMRARMPYLPIIQRPQRVFNVVMDAVTPIAVDVNFHTGDALVRFTSNSDFYVSFDGRAYLPVATGESGIICNPPPEWYPTGGTKQISVFSPNVGAVICCAFIGD